VCNDFLMACVEQDYHLGDTIGCRRSWSGWREMALDAENKRVSFWGVVRASVDG
jgi:hypothetical protein